MYVVLFDIDGTLIQTGGAGHMAFADAFREEFGVAELCGDVPFAGRSDRAISSDLMRAHDIAPTERHWERFRDRYLKCLPNALGRCRGSVLTGVAEFIAALQRTDDVAIGLLTGNIRAGAKKKLSHYGLDHHFDFGGFGDESTDRSDIARIALEDAKRHVLERRLTDSPDANRSDPLRGVMVLGDTIYDVRCARAIDAFAVALPTGNTSAAELEAAAPDALLDDLSDFSRLLEIVRG